MAKKKMTIPQMRVFAVAWLAEQEAWVLDQAVEAHKEWEFSPDKEQRDEHKRLVNALRDSSERLVASRIAAFGEYKKIMEAS